MSFETTDTESRLESLLQADARAELRGTDAALADRFLDRLGDGPRRSRGPALVLGAGLAAAAIAVGAIVWSAGRVTPSPAPQIAGVHPAPVQRSSPESVIAHAEDDLLEPLRREMRALGSISRDSIRNFAGYLPVPLGG